MQKDSKAFWFLWINCWFWFPVIWTVREEGDLIMADKVSGKDNDNDNDTNNDNDNDNDNNRDKDNDNDNDNDNVNVNDNVNDNVKLTSFDLVRDSLTLCYLPKLIH